MPNPSYDEFKKWTQYFSTKFHTIVGLIVAWTLCTILLLGVHQLIRDDFKYETISYSAILIGILLIWLVYKFNYPKNNRKQTGLVISLYAKNKEALELKEKFLYELHRDINDAKLNKIFNLIDLKNHLAQKVNNEEELKKLHKKVKGHIYFYGDIQKERDGEKDKYFLVLHGSVQHKPVPIPFIQALSVDFTKLLPQDINFDSLFELRGCKATASITFLTTKYITGVASFVSWNPFLALELHKGLAQELNKYKEINGIFKEIGELTPIDLKYINKIKNKLPLIISKECYVISLAYYKNKNYIQAQKYIEEALTAQPNDYAALLLNGKYLFELNHDPIKALEAIKKSEKISNRYDAWIYSKTFLLFWRGDYIQAWKGCQKICNNSYQHEENTLKEVDDFNNELLRTHTDKPQLYFWLGFLQYKKAQNIPMAYDYLTKFCAYTDKNLDFLKIKAKSYLSEMDKIIFSKKSSSK